jgi:hypothetical protein
LISRRACACAYGTYLALVLALALVIERFAAGIVVLLLRGYGGRALRGSGYTFGFGCALVHRGGGDGELARVRCECAYILPSPPLLSLAIPSPSPIHIRTTIALNETGSYVDDESDVSFIQVLLILCSVIKIKLTKSRAGYRRSWETNLNQVHLWVPARSTQRIGYTAADTSSSPASSVLPSCSLLFLALRLKREVIPPRIISRLDSTCSCSLTES